MNFRGYEIDPVSLWEKWVDFPQGMDISHEFSSVVMCPNPQHDARRPHFQVNLKKPLVHCFSRCGISGSYEYAVAMILGLYTKDGDLDERAARKTILRFTTGPSRIEPPTATKNGTRKTFDSTAFEKDWEAYTRGLYRYLPLQSREYLDKRGIDTASRGKWGLGWDGDSERLVIPAFDAQGTLRFLIRRAIDGRQPKYLYTAGSVRSSLLYGVSCLDRASVREYGLILVEGSLDVIRLHQHGFKNVAAILGTGISTKQCQIIDRIWPPRIYLFFDRDGAGVENILIAHKRLPKYPLRVVRYAVDKDDPAQLTRKEVEAAIERAIPISQFFRKTPELTRR